jgi:hypothetical protein
MSVNAQHSAEGVNRPSVAPPVKPSKEKEKEPAAIGLKASIMSLVPGAAQGASQVLLGHPLDTIKTRVQTAPLNNREGHKVFSVMKTMIREEGVISLYRGVSPPLLLTASKRSLQFALWERLNVYFGSKGFISGGIAGVLGTVVGCPMHVIKIQTQNTTRADLKNAWSCFLYILRNEGIRGLYRGMYAQILKDTAFASVYLGLYGYGREWASKMDGGLVREPVATEIGAPHGSSFSLLLEYKSFRTFLVGCLASMMTWALLQPLDTFKTFVQSKHSPKEFILSVRQADGGLRFIWRGLPAALIRAGPVSGCAMIVYESIRTFISKATGEPLE